jgi:hypothetical protein
MSTASFAYVTLAYCCLGIGIGIAAFMISAIGCFMLGF